MGCGAPGTIQTWIISPVSGSANEPIGHDPNGLTSPEREGEGLHWPDLDEDISIEGLLAGRRSGETQASLRRWLDNRKAG